MTPITPITMDQLRAQYAQIAFRDSHAETLAAYVSDRFGED